MINWKLEVEVVACPLAVDDIVRIANVPFVQRGWTEGREKKG